MGIVYIGRKNYDSTAVVSANSKYVGRNYLPHDAIIEGLFMLGAATSTLVRVKALVYDDNSGSPGNLLYTSPEYMTVNGTFFRQFSSPILLYQGYYHIGVILNNYSFTFRCLTSSGTNNKNSDTYSDGPSDPFGTPDSPAPTSELVIYAMCFTAGTAVSKLIGYSVLRPPVSSVVSKVLGYAVLDEPREDQRKPIVFVVT